MTEMDNRPRPQRYALFLGCNIPVRAQNYEMSARAIAAALGVEFVDIPEFGCCGYPLGDGDKEQTTLLSARNLALAEKAGCDVCALCSACAGALTETARELAEDEALRERINGRLAESGLSCSGKTQTIHFARLLYEGIGLDAIREKVSKPLEGLRVAPHYGCHFLKPSRICGFDDPENPRSLDDLIAAAGAEPVDYPGKLRCCGGGVLAVDEATALKVTQKKLAAIAAAGADAIGLACPFCAVMYDTNQKAVETRFSETYGIPVLFISQILGLAMGLDPKDLGLKMNRVKTNSLLEKVGV